MYLPGRIQLKSKLEMLFIKALDQKRRSLQSEDVVVIL
jgi:hypothetical protein